jgi:lysozyme family protein
MTEPIDADLFRIIRDVKGSGLTASEVNRIKSELIEHGWVEPDTMPASGPVPAPQQVADEHYGPDGYLTPAAVIAGYIGEFEGVLSMDPDDTGNWYRGQLIGSKFGVIGATLALYRQKVGNPEPVNKATMAALTREEAIKVGVTNFWNGYDLDHLPWNRVTMNGLDGCWASGIHGVKMIQRTVGANPDGKISAGGETATKFTSLLAQVGEEELAHKLIAERLRFVRSIATGVKAKYLKGWSRRINSFAPGTAWWAEAKR